jgi:phospholipid/cholesterol/gamma-HCH transport system substrate-binding protein
VIKKLTLVLTCMVAASLVGCGSPYTIDTTARFTDVGDLAKQAPVMLADIQVGEVTDIHLAGTEAVVSMALDPKAEVPTDVTARVRRTSVLGERIIDLVVPEDLAPSAELLADGESIDNTETRSDLEDLVGEGSEVLGAITAADLAVMIQEGAKGFGDQGLRLRELLQNYDTIIRDYDDSSDDIISMIENMNEFNQIIAPETDAHVKALQNTARSFEVLREESDKLEEAILSLDRLARGSESILNEHSDEMSAFFRQMRVILGVLADEQDSIRLLLKHAPGHAENTQRVEYAEFNQVVQEFIICGLNDQPNDPARRCKE